MGARARSGPNASRQINSLTDRGDSARAWGCVTAAPGVGCGVQRNIDTPLMLAVFSSVAVHGDGDPRGDDDPHGDGGDVVARYGRKHDGVHADPSFFTAAPTRAPTARMKRDALDSGRESRLDQKVNFIAGEKSLHKNTVNLFLDQSGGVKIKDVTIAHSQRYL